MVRLNSLKFALSTLWVTSLYGIGNSDLPQYGHKKDSPLINDKHLFPAYAYKGIHPINQYGWFIGPVWEKQYEEISFNNEILKVTHYIKNPGNKFAIFKTDAQENQPISQTDKLKNLATLQDLNTYSGWVTSLTFIKEKHPELKRITEETYKILKPLSAISKIEKHENGKIFISKGNNFESACKEIWHKLRKNKLSLTRKSNEYLENLKSDPKYRQDYIIKKTGIDLGSIVQQLNSIECKINIHKVNKIYNEHQLSIPSSSVLNEHATQYLQNINVAKKELEALELKGEKIYLPLMKVIDVWNKHFTALSEKQDKNFRIGEELNRLKLFDNSTRNKIIDSIQYYFSTPCNGVADKEDNGGLILLYLPNLIPSKNKYVYECKIVGITNIHNKDEAIKGEKSVAIDLTTPEMHQWISDTIDKVNKNVISNPRNYERPTHSSETIDLTTNRKRKSSQDNQNNPKKNFQLLKQNGKKRILETINSDSDWDPDQDSDFEPESEPEFEFEFESESEFESEFEPFLNSD